jgi:hypothetical protein
MNQTGSIAHHLHFIGVAPPGALQVRKVWIHRGPTSLPHFCVQVGTWCLLIQFIYWYQLLFLNVKYSAGGQNFGTPNLMATEIALDGDRLLTTQRP